MFAEGSIEDNAQAPLHFQDGVPHDWTLQAHWDNAGLLVWSVSPVEPVAALLLDLGPIALADYNATLQGGTAGDHLHGVISARPGPWFDWYRDIIDPALRTPSQVARLKAEVAHQLRVALVGALVG
jgi:hypothetical protein